MYALQYRLKQNRNLEWLSAGRRSDSMNDLKDLATACNMDYRIITMTGTVVWEFNA